MTRKSQSVIVIATLAALAIGVGYWVHTAPERIAREAMEHVLVDSESARFEKVGVHRTQGGDGAHICGVVNAKNRMGGYTGKQRFVMDYPSSDSEAGGLLAAMNIIFEADSPLELRSRWAMYCAAN